MKRFVFGVCLIVFVCMAHGSAYGRKDPTVALLLALLLPGGGQIYNEQPKKALIPIGGLLGAGALMYADIDGSAAGVLSLSGALIMVSTWVWSIFDAPMTAGDLNVRRSTHLMEFDGNRMTLGVDPIAERNRSGAMLSVRF